QSLRGPQGRSNLRSRRSPRAFGARDDDQAVIARSAAFAGVPGNSLPKFAGWQAISNPGIPGTARAAGDTLRRSSRLSPTKAPAGAAPALRPLPATTGATPPRRLRALTPSPARPDPAQLPAVLPSTAGAPHPARRGSAPLPRRRRRDLQSRPG